MFHFWTCNFRVSFGQAERSTQLTSPQEQRARSAPSFTVEVYWKNRSGVHLLIHVFKWSERILRDFHTMYTLAGIQNARWMDLDSFHQQFEESQFQSKFLGEDGEVGNSSCNSSKGAWLGSRGQEWAGNFWLYKLSLRISRNLFSYWIILIYSSWVSCLIQLNYSYLKIDWWQLRHIENIKSSLFVI